MYQVLVQENQDAFKLNWT